MTFNNFNEFEQFFAEMLPKTNNEEKQKNYVKPSINQN